MKKIDHIGIAVKNINEAKAFYENNLGLKSLGEETVKDQKVKAAIFECGDIRIELLEPLDANSPITKFLDKKGNGIHHIAIQVDDIESELKELKKQGVNFIDEILKIGIGGHKITFIHPKSTGGVLIELVE
jgi:methylmalonyl-CoA epimerase